MEKIIRAEDLKLEDKVYLKKGMFGYRVVHPVRNEDGSINWINMFIGGWGNLFKLLFILLVIFLFLYGVKEMMGSCKEMAKNPCVYCRQKLEITGDSFCPDCDWGGDDGQQERV